MKSLSWIEHVYDRYFPLVDPHIPLSEKSRHLLSWCESEKVHLLSPDDFPVLLKEIADYPPWLFVKGTLESLYEGAAIALVGARRPSAYGLRAAHGFSRGLVEGGATLISGLARGIDAIAHATSVQSGKPTIAVLAHGLDRLYPTCNRVLSNDVLRTGGCLVSEYPVGVQAQPYHFPRRNRILSGLALGVVVIEAGAKSGSLTTAHHAVAQNREVFVVPGPFYEEGFEGSHALIQQGARLVTRWTQIAEELRPGVLPGLEKSWKCEDLEKIKTVFKGCDVASYAELLAQLKADPQAVRHLIERGVEQGWLYELGPQRYVYRGA